jgi:hypothetical protein
VVADEHEASVASVTIRATTNHHARKIMDGLYGQPEPAAPNR